jgi:hypothetical protein
MGKKMVLDEWDNPEPIAMIKKEETQADQEKSLFNSNRFKGVPVVEGAPMQMPIYQH